ncbi:hypothetical protein P7L53_14940 [Thermoleptolyngbya sichuanensis XZ-Cy5]|uniref:hypothetical protein n=1 Tax=Thermoleptolyngbya sichuanensis TaxID=2885951 RepID=UPI00240D12EE|nr:hypothetical protein [Thermoleptolyngbya sichuanensis]MDG2617535.1 hypothetical protein [Thermoleptolyngbya sichuanensis XZ-Cy5]
MLQIALSSTLTSHREQSALRSPPEYPTSLRFAQRAEAKQFWRFGYRLMSPLNGFNFLNRLQPFTIVFAQPW